MVSTNHYDTMERDELVRLAGEQALLKKELSELNAEHQRDITALRNLANDIGRTTGWRDRGVELLNRMHEREERIALGQRRHGELGKLTGKEYIVKTIVTTETIKSIADANNIKMYDCYTGFKWIAREIRLREGKQQYIGGGEESYGFLAEDFVRDNPEYGFPTR